MMRWVFFITLLFIAGCSRSTVAPTAQTPAQTASNEDGSVVVHLYTNATEITTMDQMQVTIELSRTPATVAAIEPIDWSSTGWTVISQTHAPETEVDTRLVTIEKITLEPFLDGQYTIPSVIVSAGSWKLATDPFEVSVTSVLPNDDAGEVVVTTELLPPSAPHEPRRGSLVLIVVGLGLIFAGSVFWWTSRPDRPSPSVREQLEHIAGGEFDDEREALALVHHLVHTLHPNERLAHVLDTCERIRFSGSSVTTPTAQALAGEALESLEVL